MASNIVKGDGISIEFTRLLVLNNKINIYSEIASCNDELYGIIKNSEVFEEVLLEKLGVLTDLVKVGFSRPTSSSQSAEKLSNFVSQVASHDETIRLAEEIILDICIPLLKLSTDDSKRNHLCINLIRVLSASLEDCSFNRLFTELITIMTTNLCEDDEAVSLRSQPMYIADLFTDLLSKDSQLTAGTCDSTMNGCRLMLINHCLPILSKAGDRLAGRIATSTIPRVLRSLAAEEQTTAIRTIWVMICELFDRCNNSTDLLHKNRPHMLLCSLAEFILPMQDMYHNQQDSSEKCDACKQYLKDAQFWRMLQSGLHNASTSCRKQSLYVLKRILDAVQMNMFVLEPDPDGSSVFWWDRECSAEMSAVWHEFILLMETLEETQIHIIKPLMPRLQTLVSATAPKPKGVPAMLHTSWLMGVFHRISAHESTLVKRCGLMQLLSIDYIKCPIFQQHQQQFFYGPFVTMLTDSAIYHKPADVALGACIPVGQELQNFFRGLPEILKQTELADFLHEFVRSLCTHSWNGAALVYVVLGMSQLPPMALWEAHVLTDFMDLLAVGLHSIDCHIRGAIQCLLLKLFTCLVNVDSVGPQHLASVLGVLSSDECLRRGTASWTDLADWLRQASNRSLLWHADKLREYVADFIQILMKVPMDGEMNGVPDQSLLSATRLALLACDAGLLPWQPDECYRHGNNSLQTLLWPILDVLHRGSAHAYMSTRKVDRALQFVVTLLKEWRLAKEANAGQLMMDKLVRDCSPKVILYISRQLPELTNLINVDRVQLYKSALETLLTQQDGSTCVTDGVPQLVTVCIEMLQNITELVSSIRTQTMSFVAMSMLAALCNTALSASSHNPPRCQHQLCTYLHQMPIMTSFQKPTMDESAQSSGDGTVTQTHNLSVWGRLASGFLASQWTCITWLLNTQLTTLQSSQYELYTSQCMETTALVSEHSLLPLFRCFQSLMPHLSTDSTVAILSVGWNKTKEQMKSRAFWKTYELFIRFAFHANNIRQSSPVSVCTMLEQIGSEVFELGRERPGLTNTLVSHLSQYWTQDDICPLLCPLLVSALLFGDTQKKGIRFIREVQHYLYSFGDKLTANQLVDINLRSDNVVRASALTTLSKLQPTSVAHCSLAQMVIARLMDAQRQLAGSKRYHTFPNCSSHRRKMRLFSALLVLLPFLKDTPDLWPFLMDMLRVETLPSVRCLIEWLVVRLVHLTPGRSADIWANLEQNSQYRGAALCSLMMIVWQASKLVKTREHDTLLKTLFMQKAIRHILPWCIEHHFNTKVFALAVLTMLWLDCKLAELDAITIQFSMVELLTRQAQNSYGQKCVEKLLDNFFFTFDPIRDFSMETITDTLPRLSGVADDECLSTSMFLYSDATWREMGEHSLLLYNESDELKCCTPGSWRVKVTDFDDDSHDEGNVQKKMIPWQAMFPLISDHPGEDGEEGRKRPGGLILVTSLINKIPNLGGLCRTCEIFGVSEFIVGSMKHVEDKGFQNMSVTADTWIPIREVKPRLLADYLTAMKEVGYTLVGVEQTAHSKCLTDFQFPTKTLLLLGNEKQGIPMSLLQLMDVCVEIPQQGVVRSLNVHVSGAIFIWEYTRQQLASQQS